MPVAPGSHLVVDGSNIATEGRSQPSLMQLDEAVRAFLEEYPHDHWTVVVDATFEHRIDSSEQRAYDEALAAGELLTPPAGTIGRGDRFILQIADRVDATVFSNDSFQEFHADYPWLFDEGRLIGGKPVPGVGWIFAPRTPVRGAKSRMVTRAAGKKAAKALGITWKQQYLVMGEYDIITVLEAPNDELVAKFALMGMTGSLAITTVRAFTESEADKLIKGLQPPA